MSTRGTTTVRRTAAAFTLVGAGFAFTGAGTAWATPAPATCGTPAHAALYKTVNHAAVPAVTHEVTVIDQAFVPAVPGVDEVSHVEVTTVIGDGVPEGEGWSATGTTWTVEDTAAWTEYEWQRTVVDQAAVPGSPAVPAVTHDEVSVVTPAWDETVIVTPASPEVLEVSHLVTVVDKAAWDETVVVTPAVPAVDEVSHMVTVVDEAAWDETVVADDGYAFVQKQTGKVRYESSATWNTDRGQDLGWSRASELDKTTVVHHAAKTHEEKVIDTPASPGAPAVTRVVHHEAQTHEEKVIDTPNSPAVAEVSRVVHHAAVTVTVTVVDAEAIPAVDAVEEVSHQQVDWTRSPSSAPEGEGWSLTGEEVAHPATSHTVSELSRTVVDAAAVAAVPEVPELSHTETVVDVEAVPAWDEQVLVAAAVPAGPACVKIPTAVDGMTPPAGAPALAAAAPATVTAVAADELAQTGLDLALPLGAGLVLVFVGGALVAIRREPGVTS